MRKLPQAFLRAFVGEISMQIRTTGLDWYLDDVLIKILTAELAESGEKQNVAVTLNFRDPNYCAENGGCCLSDYFTAHFQEYFRIENGRFPTLIPPMS